MINIDNIVCLSLDKRINNWDYIKTNIQFYFDKTPQMFLVGDGSLDLRYSHIDVNSLPPILPLTTNYGGWWKKSAYNCWLSHAKILTDFYNSNNETILMLEDDMFFEDDFEELWKLCYSKLDSLPWDMIYFGCFHCGKSKKITEHIYQLNGCGGFHAVLLKKIIAKKLLDFGPIGPMDDTTGRFIQKEHKCYTIYPSIITQRSGYSYVATHNINMPSRYNLS
jgi:hypothetical protein